MPDGPPPGIEPDLECAAAQSAGWRGCDLDWERLQERALDALQAGDPTEATQLWRDAWLLAVPRFGRDDPRRATSVANLGLAARLAGSEARARRRFAHALKLWGAAPDWIARMSIARRARSSLLHLRMEATHWPAYEASLRSRSLALAREAAVCLDAAARGQPLPHRLHDRWRGEKPSAFDDMRKFLGAALLVAAAEPEPNRNRR